MSKPLIFISCGQYTTAEKALGKAIYDTVESLGMKPFFAETVQDFKGLNENILDNLRDCVGFITVMHPRGKIQRPNGSFERASVWIEQEIAITAYIRHVEKRPLRVIAFIHKDVGREGIRDLLHLNPIVFSDEMEILRALPALLQAWDPVAAQGIVPKIEDTLPIRYERDHPIRKLMCWIVNNSNLRIEDFNGRVRVPSAILTHSAKTYPPLDEDSSDDPKYRSFRFDGTKFRPVDPQSKRYIGEFEYCMPCAINNTSDVIEKLTMSDMEVEMTVWVNGQRYEAIKSLKQLALEIETHSGQDRAG